MSSLIEVSQALNGGPLLSRFTAAVWAAATTIVNEDPATPQHANRIEWAKRALILDGKSQAYAFMVMRLAFSENVTLRAALPLQNNGDAIADVDILAAVNGYVPKFVAASV